MTTATFFAASCSAATAAAAPPVAAASVAALINDNTRSQDCIYLDNAAASPLDRRVLDVMFSVFSKDVIGNAHAKHHPFGGASAMTVQKAREQVAESIGANPNEIVFTSGATESNNLIIKGLARHLKASGRTRIITAVVEHKSILEPLAQLKAAGFEVIAMPVKPCGMITADVIERVIDERTGLVCVQAVNNETGTIQPLAKIAEVLAERNILFHSDAAQALGKVPFSVPAAGVDFASLSAHKVYGPHGIGAAYVRADKLRLLEPLHAGGGQELGVRSGTLPVALCAGFGTACSLIEDDRERLQALRTSLIERIAPLEPVIYGHRELRCNVPGILNIRFPGIDSETLIMALPGLAVGTGSACSSAGARLSHVIQAITGEEQAARESIRLSFGRLTTEHEMDRAAEQIFVAITSIRQLQEVA
ncbi:MAG: cysteine desulfurase family protein [Terriglobales bacterium]